MKTNRPAPLVAEGPWANVFAYHPMDVELARAEGIYLFDTEGRRYIDASGGPMAVNLGHGDKRVQAAMNEQLARFAYVHPVLANRPRADLCEAIAQVTPRGLNATYLVSGGSEAVETALKIARQYWVAAGQVQKHKIISFFESYHGMTLATVQLSGNPRALATFESMTARWPKVEQYSEYEKPKDCDRDTWAIQCARRLATLIEREGPETIAAFIGTLHGCGSEYGVVAPAAYWHEIRRICDQYDVLFIADEVVTGFGRTGRWFASDHFDVLPDIMVFAKGISSCYAPLGAVTVSERVNEPFRQGAAFVHGFTFGGHPLACAAGLAVLQVLKADELVEAVPEKGRQLFSSAERLLSHPSVADVRGWGLFMVLELVSDKVTRGYFPPERNAERAFQSIALSNGLAIYSSLYGQRRGVANRGLPLWICPPLSILPEQIDDLVERLEITLSQWELEMGFGQ